MVVRVLLAQMGDLGPAGSLLPAGDPGQELKQEVVDYFLRR